MAATDQGSGHLGPAGSAQQLRAIPVHQPEEVVGTALAVLDVQVIELDGELGPRRGGYGDGHVEVIRVGGGVVGRYHLPTLHTNSLCGDHKEEEEEEHGAGGALVVPGLLVLSPAFLLYEGEGKVLEPSDVWRWGCPGGPGAKAAG